MTTYLTIQETEAYDRGFAEAKDYWQPKEYERILAILNNFTCDNPDCDQNQCKWVNFAAELIEAKTNAQR